MALASYESLTRFLLHDPAPGQAYSTNDIDTAINIARKQIAGEGECVRARLSGGVITALNIISGGSGYSGNPTVTITGGGSQTFATATISGGAVNSITLIDGGWGWVAANVPLVTVTGWISGSNAAIVAVVDNSASTAAQQERIRFSTLNILAATIPGIQNVVGINSIATQWGAGSVYKPMIRRRSWSWFQANARVYSISAMNFPAYWAQHLQGANGDFYLFPIPSQQMSLDIDAVCLPIPLLSDATPEAIPDIWGDAVPYYAAYMMYMNSSREADAKNMLALYTKFMQRARKASEASAFVPDQYEGM